MNADTAAISAAKTRQIRVRWSGRDAVWLVVLLLVILISSSHASYQLALRGNNGST